MSFGKALYFPYIHFQDLDWLKYSLLYWDAVKRIVPPGYEPEDDPGVRRLVDAGLIESVDPKSGETPYTVGAAEEFIPTMNQLLDNRLNPGRGATIAATVDANTPEATIHAQKMDERVIGLLQESNLARRVGDWFSMETGLAGYYMICLAAHISEKQQAPLLSDSFEMETAGTMFQHARVSEEILKKPPEDLGLQLARLVLPVPRPEHLAGITTEQLIEFHGRHQGERMQFRQAVEKVAQGAGALADPTARKDFLEQEKKKIAQAVAAQADVINELRVGSVHSLFSVTVPAVFGAPVAALSGDPTVTMIGAGVGIALSIINWFAGVRGKRRQAIRQSDWHYLLSVQKDFAARDIASRAQSAFREFIYD